MTWDMYIKMLEEDKYREGESVGLEKGREEGREEGELAKLLSIIKKKIQKNKTARTISEELEENQQIVEPLYNLISENPDKEIDELVSILNKRA